MGRALRIEYPDALYHVMADGNGMQWIYNKGKHLILFKEISLKLKIKTESACSQMNYRFINKIRKYKNFKKMIIDIENKVLKC